MTVNGATGPAGRPAIWIDLDNTPHVPFFAPIIEALRERGYGVTLTARDAYQVCELADLFELAYTRVGRHHGKSKVLKVLGTGLRSVQLLPVAQRARPALAVTHGSRSQVLAAAMLRIPSLVILDYEFTASWPGPTWVMVPEVMPESAIRCDPRRVLRYPGLKEDVYAPTFQPDPSIRSRLGLDDAGVVVTLRPPATEAHYHRPQSDLLFAATLEFLGRAPEVRIVLLPRNRKQEAALRTSWPGLFAAGKITVPEQAVDGLNLIWHSDLVISGGGTMNREAAALGVPVYSIFRGRIGAVDRALAEAGRLVLVESVEDVRAKIVLERRARRPAPPGAASLTLKTIVEHIVSLAERPAAYESRRIA